MDENEVMTTEVDESVESQEVAEPETEEVDTTEAGVEEQEVADPEPQSREQNAIYANIRRQAEAEAQKKFDKQIASLCKDVVHPITGQPITSFAEYEDAINAQNRIQAQKTLEANNVDISVLDEYVNSSPVLARAQQIIEQNDIAQANAQLKADFEELQKLNSDLKTFGDLMSDPNCNAILDRVAKGDNLVEAYKIVNFDALVNRETKSAKQAAINQARGKSHLEPTESMAEASDGNEIPESMMHSLRANFPDKSDKELRKLYKQTFK